MANAGHSPSAKLPRVFLVFSLVCILGMIGWTLAQRTGHGNHWREVARARYYLDRGQTDLAFQAVSGIRDNSPVARKA